MKLEQFLEHLNAVAPDVPRDEEILRAPTSPLAAPLDAGKLQAGNRWVIHPMEGWDGTADGNPSELTVRRWRNFGESGAKLIWGGEAVAVQAAGRANPNQLVSAEHTREGIGRLRQTLLEAHKARFGSTSDLVVGLQLTHSGRFSRPTEKARPEPRVAFRHPILDGRVGVTNDAAVLTDGEIEGLIEDFVVAACRARDLGFQFVDVKHCHGYLLHEFLGAHTRPGRYGGSLENRTRLLKEVVAGIRRDAPELEIGVRVSIFDVIPYRPDPEFSEGTTLGPGVPEDATASLPYRYGFGVNAEDPAQPDLEAGPQLLEVFAGLGIRLVSISAGSPYYNPHVQRPALYPPSDGYQPPEDPLIGVARHLRATQYMKHAFPHLTIIGTAFSYLQDYLPHVAQAVVREGWMDAVGIGRMVLSYWDMPADCLEHGKLQRKRICRTFSDCTTAPRKGLISGCYPLDPHYAALAEAKTLREIKNPKRVGP